MTGFSHIVSLGYRCRTTRRLRDHFGFATAFPFDWWITPLAGGVRVLRDWDLGKLYDPKLLRERREWGRVAYIENTDYGVRLQHEFPMDEAREHVLPGWREHIGAARTRTAHLLEKFDVLNRPDRRVLFVRELKETEQSQLGLVKELRRTVIQRTPRAEASFLLISPRGVDVEGWIPLKIDDPTKEPWTGTPPIWDTALATLDFRVERRAGWGEDDGPDLRAGRR